jgi:UDP-N-acetylmuramate--alanine ligase
MLDRAEKIIVFGRPDVDTVHLVGIGGAGMNVLARILLSLGFRVTGSDLKLTAGTGRLARRGARIGRGHGAERLGNPDLLVYSSAVPPDNPELARARERGIAVIHRSELLAGLTRLKPTVAVAGSHGKTTTAALIAWILVAAGEKPSLALGGEAIGLEDHPGWDEGGWLVAEADESDGSLSRLSPRAEVLTGLDLDHVDYYSGWEKLILTFERFTKNLPPDGVLVIGEDTPHLHRLARGGFRVITYGLGEGASLRGRQVSLDAAGSSFDVYRSGVRLGRARLPQLGLCGVINSLGAAAFCLDQGLDFEEIARGLESFPGVSRRLEIKARRPVMVIEDYAHHPAEVAAALTAVRSAKPGKIFCVFQPHRYSRTRHFARDLAEALTGADRIILAELYPAFEDPLPGVSSKLVLRSLEELGRSDALLLERSDIRLRLERETAPGDAVVIMGAGPIGTLAGELARAWSDPGEGN